MSSIKNSNKRGQTHQESSKGGRKCETLVIRGRGKGIEGRSSGGVPPRGKKTPRESEGGGRKRPRDSFGIKKNAITERELHDNSTTKYPELDVPATHAWGRDEWRGVARTVLPITAKSWTSSNVPNIKVWEERRMKRKNETVRKLRKHTARGRKRFNPCGRKWLYDTG